MKILKKNKNAYSVTFKCDFIERREDKKMITKISSDLFKKKHSMHFGYICSK